MVYGGSNNTTKNINQHNTKNHHPKNLSIRPISAKQSSVFGNKKAQLAIDLSHKTCSVAGVGSESMDIAWFVADLGRSYASVVKVVLLNSPDYYGEFVLCWFVGL